ncbi:MAG: hypothetical protein LC803_23600 [Acidobacteria bacterium]|nr:hypothetical protein [Acidobacteriota bacterium]
MNDLEINKNEAARIGEDISRRYHKLDKLIADKINLEFERRAGELKRPDPLLAIPDRFANWFRNLTLKAKTFYSVILTIPGLTFIGGLMLKALSPALPDSLFSIEEILLGVLFLQLLIVFVLYWIIPKPKTQITHTIGEIGKQTEIETERVKSDFQPIRYRRANKIAVKFYRIWKFAWLSWAILYFAWGCIALLAVIPAEPSLIFNVPTVQRLLEICAPITNFFNNLTTVFLILCFRELAFPTEPEESSLGHPFFILLTIIGFAAVLEFISVNIEPLRSIAVVLGWGGSFAAGVVIALLIGRLESKLIDPPLILIVMLYLYAVMQATIVLFPGDLELMITLTSAALIFKVILFLLIYWLLDSKVLIFYLAEIGVRHETIELKRKAFVKFSQSKNLDII